MKKTLQLFFLLLFSGLFFSQYSKEEILGNIKKLESANTNQMYIKLSNYFIEMDKNNIEMDVWLPKYYAGYAKIKAGQLFLSQGKKNEAFSEIEKGIILVNDASDLFQENAETYIVLSVGYEFLNKIKSDTRYVDLARNYLNKSEVLDPNNPRFQLIKTMRKFPIEDNKKVKEEVMSEYKRVKEYFVKSEFKSDFHPSWGLEILNKMIGDK